MNPLSQLLQLVLHRRLIAMLLLAFAVLGGLITSPFRWHIPGLPRHSVPVDALPDISENQQIVICDWEGRSPQDVEDQVSYPLSIALMGVPKLKTIRSESMFGFSSIYLIFEDDVDFYWARSRVLERLASLPSTLLPEGVTPTLGPDATPLGQVFWYTLEGRDEEGRATGGWDLDELRTIQDFQVRYALAAADGVSEIASIGGYVREYQIDVDPVAMRAFDISLEEVFAAVQGSNVDVGARTIEVNRVEYVIRGVGKVTSIDDLRRAVISVRENVPIYVENVAQVTLGPALRRGALDKGGVEVVGGVVVVRYGENPLEVIENVKSKIAEIASSLPRKQLPDGRTSQISIIPFYDRTQLIEETLGTLSESLGLEILLTMLVVLVMMRRLSVSLLVAGLLPVAVLLSFIGMRLLGVEANIVALAGIAIAIGTMVDMGIVMAENIETHLRTAPPGASRLRVIFEASNEVGGAVFTALLTTVLAFLPVFGLTGPEGKLFAPLAYTKTLALIASMVVALLFLPPLALTFLRAQPSVRGAVRWVDPILWIVLGLLLADLWRPLGEGTLRIWSWLSVLAVVAACLYGLHHFQRFYPRILAVMLERKAIYSVLSSLLVLWGVLTWQGAPRLLGGWTEGSYLARLFPGLGREFMPTLDEGSFLYMPTTMVHASMGETLDVLHKLDLALASVPEVEMAVGKLGRVESALDPAPISMMETVVQIKPKFTRDAEGKLVRQWREGVESEEDVWDQLVAAAQVPGTTSAPKLAPIAARIVMLQSGMRAPMGIKVSGPDLETIEAFGIELEQILRGADGVRDVAVLAERVVGKPYLEIRIDREAIARYGLRLQDVQDVIEVAVGGRQITTTIEGRRRQPVRVRYLRELRDSVEELGEILVPTQSGAQIPLIQLAEIVYVRGPQSIRSEDGFLISNVLFDKEEGWAEVDVVEGARSAIERHIESGDLVVPAGVSYRFAGTYENQVRSAARLRILVPIALALIFLVLYWQFGSLFLTSVVFSDVIVSWAGGFVMLWLYAQPWFLDIGSLREILGVQPLNLSVAVWVGFLALFGIASDDGVLMATYVQQSFRERKPGSVSEVRAAVLEAGRRRIRPCLMTIGTTLLALLPVLSAPGRGHELLVPMAVPTFGGMFFGLITLFTVPVLVAWWEERKLKRNGAAVLNQEDLRID